MHNAALLGIIVSASTALAQQEIQTLDAFDSLDAWTATGADGVEVSMKSESIAGSDGPCLRVDYNFAKGSGYLILHRKLPMDMPPNYEFSVKVRGQTLANNFEFKLINGDPRGGDAKPETDDVWWVNRRFFTFPNDWQTLRYRMRHLSFAWGPSGSLQPLEKLGALEFAISAAEGGKGTVWIDTLTFKQLPKDGPYQGTPTATATSQEDQQHRADMLVDSDPGTGWRSAAGDAAPACTVDFGISREFGGIEVAWAKGAAPAGMKAFVSEDGNKWTLRYKSSGINSERQFVPMPEVDAQFLKLEFEPKEKGAAVGVQQLDIRSVAYTSSSDEFVKAVAAGFPKGSFPRYLSGEQSYWTVTGVPGDSQKSIVNEEGAVEAGKLGFTLEPFVITSDGKVHGWDGATHTQKLVDGMLPIPVVSRTAPGCPELDVTAFAEGKPGESILHVCYQISAPAGAPAAGKLAIAVRPFQVLPPWQKLNIEGGVSPINSIAKEGQDLLVNGERWVMFHAPPARTVLATFDSYACLPMSVMEAPEGVADVRDPMGLASAAVVYTFDLEAGKAQRWWVSVPLHGKERPARLEAIKADPDASLRAASRKMADFWSGIISRVRFQVPAHVRPFVSTWCSQLAYALVNMKDKALEPGARTYDRSWIRDGNSIAAAMLEAGHPQVAKDFIEWYGGFQYENGKVPCVVDQRGPEPVAENDSHGQYINAVMTYFRFTGDKDFLEHQWTRVSKAVEYIGWQRAQRMTAEFSTTGSARQERGKPSIPATAFYGLMPESISHEGYSAKPMHSYWDDIWTWRGLKDAAEMAAVLNKDNQRALRELAEDFGKTLGSSVAAAQQAHGIEYVPGCVELGDFDGTSTAIALWPCQAGPVLPAQGLRKTMSKAWENFSKRSAAGADWTNFTPYELRQVPAMLALDERSKALDMTEWYMTHCRPKGWNHWAEVVWKEPASPNFIGDMPHSWVGAEYMHAWRTMWAFERESDQSLVVLAGMPVAWFVKGDKAPVAVQNLPTWYGPISIAAKWMGARYDIAISGDVIPPAGGIVIKPPVEKAIRIATVNDQPAEINPAGEIVVREVPAKVMISPFN